jgi:hypothetical protein
MARGGYDGNASGDPGGAWQPIEPSKSTNKGKDGQGNVGDDVEDGPDISKLQRTRAGRASFPPRPFAPTPPTPPPPHTSASRKTGNKSAPLVAQFQSNLGIVQAAVQTGRGALDGYKSCAYQGIPVSEHFGLTGRGFKAVADVLGKSLERVAAQSCREGVAEEIALTEAALARCEAAAAVAATAVATAAAVAAVAAAAAPAPPPPPRPTRRCR